MNKIDAYIQLQKYIKLKENQKNTSSITQKQTTLTKNKTTKLLESSYNQEEQEKKLKSSEYINVA
jgi:hypothetical protein